MCLAVLHHSTTDRHRLLLVANRDEAHARPTAPLHWWPGDTLLGGRDLEAGGTWFATDRRGRFGVLTNVRGVPVPARAPSRGQLIPEFLLGPHSAVDYLRSLRRNAGRYAGFNLLLGDDAGLWLYGNGGSTAIRHLEAGYHGLGNGPWDVPWVKVGAGIDALRRHRESGASDSRLKDVLSDRTHAADAHLPDTGLPPEVERPLSAAFIVQPTYGTRSTTVCRLDADGGGWVEETRYDARGQNVGRDRLTLR